MYDTTTTFLTSSARDSIEHLLDLFLHGLGMITVILEQVSRYQWELKAPNGKTMVTDLSFADGYKAEEWVKSYISSFMGWAYEIRGLK